MKNLLSTSFIALILLASSAYADEANSRQGITKQEAIGISQQAYPGRVLKVKRKGSVFNVKTLNSNGEVRIIKVDAKNGRVLNRR